MILSGVIHLLYFLQFLNKDEYLKGIDMYESIIKAFTSFDDHARDDASRSELWATGSLFPTLQVEIIVTHFYSLCVNTHFMYLIVISLLSISQINWYLEIDLWLLFSCFIIGSMLS